MRAPRNLKWKDAPTYRRAGNPNNKHDRFPVQHDPRGRAARPDQGRADIYQDREGSGLAVPRSMRRRRVALVYDDDPMLQA
jgi:hypothetical protein